MRSNRDAFDAAMAFENRLLHYAQISTTNTDMSKRTVDSSGTVRSWRVFSVCLAAFAMAVTPIMMATSPANAQTRLEELPFSQRLKLAKAGDVEAQVSVAQSYQFGGDDRKQSLVKAAEWYKRAATAGNAEAQFRLARIVHQGGQRIEKSPELAARLYGSAARQGHSEAQYWLAYVNEHADGVEADLRNAVVWYELAADAGTADAQNALGVLYLTGKGVQRDLSKALELFSKAAEQDHAWAKNNLAGMYEMGWAVSRNPEKARDLYVQAANLGLEQARENLTRLGPGSDGQQLRGTQ
jgi:TPR repeat protein